MLKIDLTNLPKITNDIYLKLFKNENRFLVLYGGAGSGKSVFAVDKIIYRILTERKHKFLIIRKVSRTLRDSVFALFQERLTQFGLKKDIHYLVNKSDMTIMLPLFASVILFKGLDDPEKIKSIAGITNIWIEEASELEKNDFMQLNLRLRGNTKYYKQIMLTFNPINEQHWLKKHFFDNKVENCSTIHSTYLNNKFIDVEYKKELENLKNVDLEYYKIYALGKWGNVKGQIYTNYEIRDLSDIKYKLNNYHYGLDFGYTNDPTAFVMCSLNRDKREIYILDEFYIKELTNDLIAEKLKEKGVADELIVCDSAEPKSIKELQNYGINAIGAKKGQGSINTGIQFIKQFKLIVDKTCINFQKELQLYKWFEDKDGNLTNKPIDRYNHLMDALSYAVEKEITGTGKFVKIEKFII